MYRVIRYMENLAPMPMVPSQHQHDHTMTPEVQPSHPSMGHVPGLVGLGMIGTFTWGEASVSSWFSTLITILDILVHVSLSSLIILRCPCDHDHNVSGQTIMSGGPRVSLHHPGEQYLNLELYKYPNILSGVPNHHRYDHIVTSNFWWKQKQTFRYEDTIFSWSKDLSIRKQDDDNTNNAWQYYLVVYYGIGLVQYRCYSNNVLSFLLLSFYFNNAHDQENVIMTKHMS
jgi:hypothetical protein